MHRAEIRGPTGPCGGRTRATVFHPNAKRPAMIAQHGFRNLHETPATRPTMDPEQLSLPFPTVTPSEDTTWPTVGIALAGEAFCAHGPEHRHVIPGHDHRNEQWACACGAVHVRWPN